MTSTWEEHQKLLTELDRQRLEREACEAQKRQEEEEAPLREQAIELAKAPVDLSRYRNERNLMLFPFCSTAKAKRVKSIRYTSVDGKRWLEVTANYEYGMAKIWDFDILRFALSKAGEVALQIGYFPPSVEFSGYECLKALGRNPESGNNLKWIKEGLTRLCLTGYSGNIFRENEKITEIFTLIKANYVDQSGKLERITISFDDRLVESVRYSKGLLVIDPKLLREEAGIKKRLLELVAVSMGKETSWTVNLERLRAMCAHEGELKGFKRQLKEYELPWIVGFSKAMGGGENVTFKAKKPISTTEE